MVPAAECPCHRRSAANHRAARASTQSPLSGRKPRLASQSGVCGIHQFLRREPRTIRLPLRTPRSPRPHTHRLRFMACHLDTWESGSVASRRRGRCDGVLPSAACHNGYSPRSGQSPAHHAHYPCECLLARSRRARRMGHPARSLHPLHRPRPRLGIEIPRLANGLDTREHPALPRR